MVTPKSTGKYSTYLAIISFGIGTLFLISYLLFPNVEQIIIFGFLYLLLAIVLNVIALIHLIYQFSIYQLERETIAIRILILLANIPIAFFYANIVFHNNLF